METTATQTEGATLPTLGEETTLPGGFVLDTREKCDWFLRKLAEFDAEEERIKAQSAAMLARNKSDRDSFQARFYEQFQRFVAEQVAADKKGRKSVIFFNGTASFRTIAPQIVLDNPQDAITTARAVLPSAITTEQRENFDKAAFLAYAAQQFEATGEILPGVRRTEERESFSVKVASPKGGAETP